VTTSAWVRVKSSGWVKLIGHFVDVDHCCCTGSYAATVSIFRIVQF
jgi:hypothetical protein